MSDPAPASWTFSGSDLLVEVRTLTVHTERPLQIVDLTPELAACVRACGLERGIVNVQVLHTTVGLLLNEREPLLFEDMERMLERLAPREAGYGHDEMARRIPPPPPGERRNGHAHCRAALLRASETLNVNAGALVLGRWQRVLLVELDGPQARTVSAALLGSAQAGSGPASSAGCGW